MKSILITGASDGLGRETARRMAGEGHHLLLHGRSADKLAAVAKELSSMSGAGPIETFQADLSSLSEVVALATSIKTGRTHLDVLINNAGVLRADPPIAEDGLDIRFAVNTLAPALLTRLLLPLIPPEGRIVHLSSAAQASVDLDALKGSRQLGAMDAYAQSKLALTIWSQSFAKEVGASGPISVAVNPGSLLATRMVREGFGIAGNDIDFGTAVLRLAALGDEFANASGQYFDNDTGRFASPHADARDPGKVAAVVNGIESLIADHVGMPSLTGHFL